MLKPRDFSPASRLFAPQGLRIAAPTVTQSLIYPDARRIFHKASRRNGPESRVPGPRTKKDEQ
jgi:hypothetical protein